MMTVGDMRTWLEEGEYPDAMHVCASLIRVTTPGKIEIVERWVDAHGVLNLIATGRAGDLDPNLKRENDLE